MRHLIDATHAVDADCWVDGANAHGDFPVQNLPLGVFSIAGDDARIGIAIGDWVLDLRGLADADLLPAHLTLPCRQDRLNALLAMGARPRKRLRHHIFGLLTDRGQQSLIQPHLYAAADCTMHVPTRIGDYTDFYVGIHHATNIGRLFRPDNPLLPNYKYVPIGYHGRASSICMSGAPVTRPSGQTKSADQSTPHFGPSKRLDYELELGVWLGQGNRLGTPVGFDVMDDYFAGLSLLNDWSARDIQAWEYQPLGPFLSKNFQTTISPWIVTTEALAPFRTAQPPRPDGDPRPLDYLWDDDDQKHGGFAIQLEVFLQTARMRRENIAAHRLSRGNSASSMYWTIAQMITHHSSNGCNLVAGDVLGTGTLSGPTHDSCGSLIELSRGGAESITLPSGEQRSFLEDGDLLSFAARAEATGFRRIGFGACTGQIHPASQEQNHV